MRPAIVEQLNKSKLTIVIVSGDAYSSDIIKLIKVLAKKYKKICYVSLNKSFEAVNSMLKNNNIDPDKFFFIETVTTSIGKPEETKQCVFIENHRALTKISISIKQALEDKSIEVIFFDSVSTLLIYNKLITVIRFMHDLMSKIRANGKTGFFICLKGDLTNDLVRSLDMFADEIIDLSRKEKTSYAELGSVIIKEQISLIGDELALKTARSVPDIKVDDSGNILTEISKEKLQALTDAYKRIVGVASIIISKRAIKPLLTGKEDLPDELK